MGWCRPCPLVFRRSRYSGGCLRPLSAKQKAERPRDSKREKRGCQNEKQPVDIWIDHDDAFPFTGPTPAGAGHRRSRGFPGSVSLIHAKNLSGGDTAEEIACADLTRTGCGTARSLIVDRGTPAARRRGRVSQSARSFALVADQSKAQALTVRLTEAVAGEIPVKILTSVTGPRRPWRSTSSRTLHNLISAIGSQTRNSNLSSAIRVRAHDHVLPIIPRQRPLCGACGKQFSTGSKRFVPQCAPHPITGCAQ